MKDIRGSIEESGVDNVAIVFVHGFRTTFEASIQRTAQLAVDIEFHGPAFAFSWPSKANALLYGHDAATIKWSASHLADFLFLLRASGIDHVHLLAHSMGSQAVVAAAKAVGTNPEAPEIVTCVLAAPDIDRGEFLNESAAVVTASKNVTLYASNNDWCLQRSHDFNGAARAGDATAMICVSGIDSIDASAIDTDFLGHGYFADARPLLADISAVISGEPLPRFGIEPIAGTGAAAWRFVP